MNATQLWQTFLETGAPEVYLLYSQAKKVDNGYVLECSSAGASGNTI